MDKIELIYGYQTLRPQAQVVFIPPTRWERFVSACWDVWWAVIQIALYFMMIMSFAVVLQFVTH